MNRKLRKLISYYRPYMGIFCADMFFAILQSAVALILPLVIRYVTGTVIYLEASLAIKRIVQLGILMIVMVLIAAYCNYFIGYYGHMMGAKIEYNMRAEIFDHYQKLSFSFYDDEKVGQLMSRITSDLFDITELLHHGPENIIISVIKIIGAAVILFCINWRLGLAAFILTPFMAVYAFVVNKYL